MISEKTRLQKLEEIAACDDIYQAWFLSYLDTKEAFASFVNSQPEHIQKMLYSYADGGRMAFQRKINLACQHMRFPEEY